MVFLTWALEGLLQKWKGFSAALLRSDCHIRTSSFLPTEGAMRQWGQVAPRPRGSEVKAMLVATNASSCTTTNPFSSPTCCTHFEKRRSEWLEEGLLTEPWRPSTLDHRSSRHDSPCIHLRLGPSPVSVPISTSNWTPMFLSSAKPKRPGQSFHPPWNVYWLIATTNSLFVAALEGRW